MPEVYMNETIYGGAKLEISTVFFKYFMTSSSVIYSNPSEGTISPLYHNVSYWNLISQLTWKTLFSPELYQINATYFTIN